LSRRKIPWLWRRKNGIIEGIDINFNQEGKKKEYEDFLAMIEFVGSHFCHI